MRAKPSSNSRAGKSNRANGKSHNSSSKINRNKGVDKKSLPDLSVLRQPVDTSISGLRQAVKVFETGTPEVIDLLNYDCDVIYECKVCRNLFRSLANFISHKRVYCTERYSRCQDLQRSNKQADNATIIIGEKPPEKLPTRITARRDLTSIMEALGGQKSSTEVNGHGPGPTVHLEPMDNTSYGVFQTVLKKPDNQELMRNQVQELQNLLSKNEVVLGPDGRVLQNGLSDLQKKGVEQEHESDLFCSACNIKFANRKTLAKHKRLFHELIRTSYSCPCCKNYFANTWSVYRHLYKVHRKTSEQVRRLRSQIHKKDFRIEKTAPNTASSKKTASPTSKKKAEQDQQLKVLQHNKEWIGHFEDDLRCGGCARKFERKAALISHSQICQKRIAACNRVEPNQAVMVQNPMSAVVALSPLPCSKKPMPKPSPEKKIGIQVRMNYYKSPSQTPQGIRHLRSITGPESDVYETRSVNGKDIFRQPTKNSVDLKDSSVLEQFLKNASKCGTSEGIDKVSSYLSNTLDKVGSYEISTCKRSTFLRSNVGKNKSLEAKCLQLRSALENGLAERLKGGKDKEVENSVYYDGNMDNTSESNTSAISSLSSQLTPLVDKAYIEVEQSIEIKNINISRTLDTPRTEADSTSMTNGGLHMTYNSRTYKGNIKFSPTKEVTSGEVSTSAVSDGISHLNSNISIDSNYLHDDEVSVNLKPISLKHEIENWTPGSEFENTISILTRNQLKAICKDDMLPVKVEKKTSPINDVKNKENGIDIESLTRELTRKRLNKYLDLINKKCSICNKMFKSPGTTNLYKHVRIHTNWKRFECLFKSCTFQSFYKIDLMSHVQYHSKDFKGKPLESLVGLIDTNKWNLKLKKNCKTVAQTKFVSNVIKKNLKKSEGTKKLVKTVNRPTKETLKTEKSGKVQINSKLNVKNGVRKISLASILKKNHRPNQKLLTDYISITDINRLNGKDVPVSKNFTKKAKSQKRKQVETSLKSREPKRPKSSPIQKKKASSPEKPTLKKRTAESSPDQKKENVIKREEIIVNHITSPQLSNEYIHKISSNSNQKTQNGTLNNLAGEKTDATVTKGRSSRTNSRKSSATRVEQQKAKSLVNLVIKNEDSNTLCTPIAYESVNSGNIIDSASLEEEESQESDRPVDDSHLKTILMEVIFGSSPNSAVLSPRRPVRNKSRPKRDSDFVLGSPRESDKDDQEIKITLNRKVSRSNISKLGTEASSSLKKSK